MEALVQTQVSVIPAVIALLLMAYPLMFLLEEGLLLASGFLGCHTMYTGLAIYAVYGLVQAATVSLAPGVGSTLVATLSALYIYSEPSACPLV